MSPNGVVVVVHGFSTTTVRVRCTSGAASTLLDSKISYTYLKKSPGLTFCVFATPAIPVVISLVMSLTETVDTPVF